MEKSILNSKVAIINNRGNVFLLGRLNEQRYHVKYLQDYASYLISNDPMFELGDLMSGDLFNRLVFDLVDYGEIIYLNEFNFGMFYFPKNLTNEQINSLNQLDLGNKKVGICYNLKNLGKIMNFRSIGMNNDCTLNDAFREYLGKVRSNIRRK